MLAFPYAKLFSEETIVLPLYKLLENCKLNDHAQLVYYYIRILNIV